MRTVWFRDSHSLRWPGSPRNSGQPAGHTISVEPGPLDLRPTDTAHFDTALRLTAIALLLRPMGPWFVSPVILAAGVLVLLFPRALRDRAVWSALALATRR
jgi:hypothetical protein